MQSAGNPELLYSLYSAKALLHQLKHQWGQAIATYHQMRPVLFAKQIPGVNLLEAIALIEQKDFSPAKALLQKNLLAPSSENTVYADSALKLGELFALQSDFQSAQASIQKSAAAKHDPQSLGSVSIEVGRAMILAKQYAKAEGLFRWTLSHVQGDTAGQVFTELAKLSILQNDPNQARLFFQEALKTTSNPGAKSWLEEMIAELNRQSE
jgi:tetratricopeptide (TPR) repeat protein